jgi:hypothetical protein
MDMIRLGTHVLGLTMMLCCAPLCLRLAAQPANPYPNFEAHGDKRYNTKHQLLSPLMLARTAVSAGINQLRNVPSGWGQGAAGYAKRFASSYGAHVVKSTIQYGVSTMRHEETSYQPSGLTGVGPRALYALESTVVTHKTDTGKPTVAAGEISGAVGTGLISRAWQPAAAKTVAKGLASGGIILGVDAGAHIAREFWPEIKRPFRH